MNKKKLIKSTAKLSGLTVLEAQKAVDAFLCTVSDSLKEDKEVVIPDFGRFYVVDCAEREVRNPKTGIKMTIPATKRVRFKAFGNITYYRMRYGK